MNSKKHAFFAMAWSIIAIISLGMYVSNGELKHLIYTLFYSLFATTSYVLAEVVELKEVVE